jgi:excisionase family DNA binding protein
MVLDNLPNVVKSKQLAEFLQVSDQTIKKAMKDGSLKAFKVGREWRIEKDEVIRWIEKGERK